MMCCALVGAAFDAVRSERLFSAHRAMHVAAGPIADGRSEGFERQFCESLACDLPLRLMLEDAELEANIENS